MVFESVCFSLRYCRGDIPVFFRKICEKYDCDEKPVLDATSAIERLELSNSSLLAASLVSIRLLMGDVPTYSVKECDK